MAKKKGFRSSNSILDAAYESLERLRRGESSAEDVKLEAKQIANAIRVMHERRVFANLAGLIEKGNNVLPDMDLE